MAAHGNGTTTFARMLYLYRTVNRFTLRDMATATGISPATLLRIEHGHMMDVETWLTFQKWLFARDGEAPRSRKEGA